MTVLAGCSGGGQSDGAAMGLTPDEASAPGSARADADRQATQSPSSPGASVTTGQLENRDRKLARTANMALRVTDIDKAAAQARAIASGVDGYTGSERIDETSATLTLTVPGEKLEPVLDDLEKLGKRLRRAISVEDVTDAVVDVESRVASQRKSVERARQQFDKATSIEDIMAVERELAAREKELESLLSRQESLQGRTVMAPIHLEITADDRAGEPGDDRGFLAGLSSGWTAFTTVISKTLHGVGAMLPFVLLIGVPVALAGWRLRRWRAHA